ncbi:hypothetical protein HK097_006405 [Rhizophlyctis rosea]|uniref:Uncharacterized protein n=1 Tax=Rhizophlyctis rosea TaxID=64517 RepID=A0AAD5X9P1_9FUNG|nr:hypothetical protein HK097_006405 [Rhizophlyctis rosea]
MTDAHHFAHGVGPGVGMKRPPAPALDAMTMHTTSLIESVSELIVEGSAEALIWDG